MDIYTLPPPPPSSGAQDDNEEEEEGTISESAYLLKNLFRYPSSSSESVSLSFMMDFWARGEAAMAADRELHESLSCATQNQDDDDF